MTVASEVITLQWWVCVVWQFSCYCWESLWLCVNVCVCVWVSASVSGCLWTCVCIVLLKHLCILYCACLWAFPPLPAMQWMLQRVISVSENSWSKHHDWSPDTEKCAKPAIEKLPLYHISSAELFYPRHDAAVWLMSNMLIQMQLSLLF